MSFSDGAESAGLRFTFENGRSPLRQLPETMSGGVALLDYDDDGWLDVYVVQGGAFPFRSDEPHDGDRLFRNKGDGSFEDATRSLVWPRCPAATGTVPLSATWTAMGDPTLRHPFRVVRDFTGTVATAHSRT